MGDILARLLVEDLQSGRLVAAAVASDKRLACLPETPTFTAVGMGNIQASNGWGIVAPKGAPPAVIEQLHALVNQVMQGPAIQGRIDKLGALPRLSSPRVMAMQLARRCRLLEKGIRRRGRHP